MVYSGIDAMSYLTMAAGKARVTRDDFVGWSEHYLRFRDETTKRTLTLPGLELYAARCALLHTYGTEADLHKEGKVARQVGYADEMLPEIAENPEIKNLVMVSVRVWWMLSLRQSSRPCATWCRTRADARLFQNG